MAGVEPSENVKIATILGPPIGLPSANDITSAGPISLFKKLGLQGVSDANKKIIIQSFYHKPPTGEKMLSLQDYPEVQTIVKGLLIDLIHKQNPKLSILKDAAMKDDSITITYERKNNYSIGLSILIPGHLLAHDTSNSANVQVTGITQNGIENGKITKSKGVSTNQALQTEEPAQVAQVAPVAPVAPAQVAPVAQVEQVAPVAPAQVEQVAQVAPAQVAPAQKDIDNAFTISIVDENSINGIVYNGLSNARMEDYVNDVSHDVNIAVSSAIPVMDDVINNAINGLSSERIQEYVEKPINAISISDVVVEVNNVVRPTEKDDDILRRIVEIGDTKAKRHMCSLFAPTTNSSSSSAVPIKKIDSLFNTFLSIHTIQKIYERNPQKSNTIAKKLNTENKLKSYRYLEDEFNNICRNISDLEQLFKDFDAIQINDGNINMLKKTIPYMVSILHAKNRQTLSDMINMIYILYALFHITQLIDYMLYGDKYSRIGPIIERTIDKIRNLSKIDAPIKDLLESIHIIFGEERPTTPIYRRVLFDAVQLIDEKDTNTISTIISEMDDIVSIVKKTSSGSKDKMIKQFNNVLELQKQLLTVQSTYLLKYLTTLFTHSSQMCSMLLCSYILQQVSTVDELRQAIRFFPMPKKKNLPDVMVIVDNYHQSIQTMMSDQFNLYQYLVELLQKRTSNIADASVLQWIMDIDVKHRSANELSDALIKELGTSFISKVHHDITDYVSSINIPIKKELLSKLTEIVSSQDRKNGSLYLNLDIIRKALYKNIEGHNEVVSMAPISVAPVSEAPVSVAPVSEAPISEALIVSEDDVNIAVAAVIADMENEDAINGIVYNGLSKPRNISKPRNNDYFGKNGVDLKKSEIFLKFKSLESIILTVYTYLSSLKRTPEQEIPFQQLRRLIDILQKNELLQSDILTLSEAGYFLLIRAIIDTYRDNSIKYEKAKLQKNKNKQTKRELLAEKMKEYVKTVHSNKELLERYIVSLPEGEVKNILKDQLNIIIAKLAKIERGEPLVQSNKTELEDAQITLKQYRTALVSHDKIRRKYKTIEKEIEKLANKNSDKKTSLKKIIEILAKNDMTINNIIHLSQIPKNIMNDIDKLPTNEEREKLEQAEKEASNFSTSIQNAADAAQAEEVEIKKYADSIRENIKFLEGEKYVPSLANGEVKNKISTTLEESAAIIAKIDNGIPLNQSDRDNLKDLHSNLYKYRTVLDSRDKIHNRLTSIQYHTDAGKEAVLDRLREIRNKDEIELSDMDFLFIYAKYISKIPTNDNSTVVNASAERQNVAQKASEAAALEALRAKVRPFGKKAAQEAAAIVTKRQEDKAAAEAKVAEAARQEEVRRAVANEERIKSLRNISRKRSNNQNARNRPKNNTSLRNNALSAAMIASQKRNRQLAEQQAINNQAEANRKKQEEANRKKQEEAAKLVEEELQREAARAAAQRQNEKRAANRMKREEERKQQELRNIAAKEYRSKRKSLPNSSVVNPATSIVRNTRKNMIAPSQNKSKRTQSVNNRSRLAKEQQNRLKEMTQRDRNRQKLEEADRERRRQQTAKEANERKKRIQAEQNRLKRLLNAERNKKTAIERAQAKAKANAEAKAEANAEAKVKRNAEAKVKRNAEAKAKANAAAKAIANAEQREREANAAAKEERERQRRANNEDRKGREAFEEISRAKILEAERRAAQNKIAWSAHKERMEQERREKSKLRTQKAIEQIEEELENAKERKQEQRILTLQGNLNKMKSQLGGKRNRTQRNRRIKNLTRRKHCQ